MENELHKSIGKKNRERIIDILCQSFDKNKSVNFVIKPSVNRKPGIRALMQYSLEICDMFGQIYLNSEQDACALVLFPEKKRTTLKTVLLDAKLALSCVGITRIWKILDREAKIKAHYPKTPICYLWFIGVSPEKQSKGKGSSLMRQIIEEHDNTPIYLETSVPQNIAFYKRFGFDVYADLSFDHQLFLLRRPPSP
ncbi:MAG TPA: GNAT family N-acetyltransferase [Bacteroidia bacterium]|jgi:GNAT superfamily N-acetyltransferase|nr:GNAT family N-acetyltransferase [Bacteroidia bacterium]